MIAVRKGSPRPVIVRKTRIVCPLPVIRSSCFSACVTQITAVNVNSPARKAVAAVRKRYRSMRNIDRSKFPRHSLGEGTSVLTKGLSCGVECGNPRAPDPNRPAALSDSALIDASAKALDYSGVGNACYFLLRRRNFLRALSYPPEEPHERSRQDRFRPDRGPPRRNLRRFRGHRSEAGGADPRAVG